MAKKPSKEVRKGAARKHAAKTTARKRPLKPVSKVPAKSKAAVTPTTSPTTTNHTELRHLVARSLGVSDDLVLDASSLRDLGVNSLDLVVLVMSIEEHFHIEFEPSDLERLRTFADLALRVAELAAQR